MNINLGKLIFKPSYLGSIQQECLILTHYFGLNTAGMPNINPLFSKCPPLSWRSRTMPGRNNWDRKAALRRLLE